MGTGDFKLDEDKTVVSAATTTSSNEKYGSTANQTRDTQAASDSVSHEDETVRRGNKTKATSRTILTPERPGDNPCLWLFHLLSGIAAVASLCLLATQMIPVLLMSNDDRWSKLGVLSMALKFYIAVFCGLFLCVETELPIPILRSSQLLQNYSSRGFLYSFVALISVEEAYSEHLTEIVSNHEQTHIGWAPIFMQISSWVMLGIGGLYFLLGLCCLQALRRKLKQDEKERWQQYRNEMKEWKEQQRQRNMA